MLYPPGTQLADVPLDARGISPDHWACELVSLLAAEQPLRSPDTEPPIERQPVATARDRYGWRSLRGSHYLGPQG